MSTVAGKKYAEVIKSTSRNKKDVKKRREASEIYKKAMKANKKNKL